LTLGGKILGLFNSGLQKQAKFLQLFKPVFESSIGALEASLGVLNLFSQLCYLAGAIRAGVALLQSLETLEDSALEVDFRLFEFLLTNR
jgi:hypothetical protein